MEQFRLPLTPDAEIDNQRIAAEMQAEQTPDLETVARPELEILYTEKIGRKRYMGRTDDEVRTAILDPEGEIERLRKVDRTDDAWEEITSIRRSS
jgi:hypothetical protein